MLDLAPSNDTPKFAFGSGDKVTIGTTEYKPVDATNNGYVLVRLDGQGVAENFTRPEMARLVALGRVKHERNALLPQNAKRRLSAPSELLSALPLKAHQAARRRHATVLAFLELETEGRVNRTDQRIKDSRDTIIVRAAKIMKGASEFESGPSAAGELTASEFSPRSLRTWLKAFEELGLAGLYDGASGRGNHDRRLCLKSQLILANCVRGFMTPEKKTQSAIHEDVRAAFLRENEHRRIDGRPELVTPSKETVRKAIHQLDPYHCAVMRDGLETARRKYAPVGIGLDLTRPLERVEIDTWKVDLITLLTDSGLLNFLDDDERRVLGLTGAKKRWHLTVAICATTRCILAMKLTRNPNARTTIQTIDMITRDKGQWADAVGTLTPWNMRGSPEWIFTDCGSEFVPHEVAVAANDLGINVQHTPGGLPEMRARIERFFKTLSIGLMPRLTGRTFSNILERGEYDSKARAALTVDDLCTALVRWVVDYYHRVPHEGLGGETPADCWDRLTEIYGVLPAADLDRRRMAFGTRMNRVCSKDGITVLGVRYHTENPAHLSYLRRNPDANIRWYDQDIGAIFVEIDGAWVKFNSVFAHFRGRTAQTWISAQRELRARYKHQAAFYENVVARTIDDIEALNANAMDSMALLSENWSEERLARDEQQLFIGFRCEPDPEDRKAHPIQPGYGDDLLAEADLGPRNEFENRDSEKDPISAPASQDADPVSTEPHDTHRDGSDLMDFEFEDKK